MRQLGSARQLTLPPGYPVHPTDTRSQAPLPLFKISFLCLHSKSSSSTSLGHIPPLLSVNMNTDVLCSKQPFWVKYAQSLSCEKELWWTQTPLYLAFFYVSISAKMAWSVRTVTVFHSCFVLLTSTAPGLWSIVKLWLPHPLPTMPHVCWLASWIERENNEFFKLGVRLYSVLFLFNHVFLGSDNQNLHD